MCVCVCVCVHTLFQPAVRLYKIFLKGNINKANKELQVVFVRVQSKMKVCVRTHESVCSCKSPECRDKIMNASFSKRFGGHFATNISWNLSPAADTLLCLFFERPKTPAQSKARRVHHMPGATRCSICSAAVWPPRLIPNGTAVLSQDGNGEQNSRTMRRCQCWQSRDTLSSSDGPSQFSRMTNTTLQSMDSTHLVPCGDSSFT